jgi:hypothetical protein
MRKMTKTKKEFHHCEWKRDQAEEKRRKKKDHELELGRIRSKRHRQKVKTIARTEGRAVNPLSEKAHEAKVTKKAEETSRWWFENVPRPFFREKDPSDFKLYKTARIGDNPFWLFAEILELGPGKGKQRSRMTYEFRFQDLGIPKTVGNGGPNVPNVHQTRRTRAQTERPALATSPENHYIGTGILRNSKHIFTVSTQWTPTVLHPGSHNPSIDPATVSLEWDKAAGIWESGTDEELQKLAAAYETWSQRHKSFQFYIGCLHGEKTTDVSWVSFRSSTDSRLTC